MMAKSLSTLTLLGATLLTLTACSSDSVPLTGPDAPAPALIERPTANLSREGMVVEFDPRVDILIVVDDSRSMRNHQKNLADNINRFVEEFSKIEAIDFRIGYTVSWDSHRYGDNHPMKVPRVCGEGTDAPGRVNWDPAGTLQPLVAPEGVALPEGRKYLTREDQGFADILKASLTPPSGDGETSRTVFNPLLIKDYVSKESADSTVCPRGAEFEEFFLPILEFLRNPEIIAANGNFRRDGALFVTIILSDAKDAGRLSAEEARDEIASLVNDGKRSRFRVFSVAMRPNDPVNLSTCVPDPAWSIGVNPRRGEPGYNPNYRVGSLMWPSVVGQNPLTELAQLTRDDDTQNHVLSICANNYGSELARLGTQIKQDVLYDMTITTPFVYQQTQDPEKKLRVFLGETELQRGVHWDDDGVQTIIIHGQNINWNEHPGAKIMVNYTPVDLTSDTTRVQ